MIISNNSEKVFQKSQHPFMEKENSKQTKKLSQPHKSHLQKNLQQTSLLMMRG